MHASACFVVQSLLYLKLICIPIVELEAPMKLLLLLLLLLFGWFLLESTIWNNNQTIAIIIVFKPIYIFDMFINRFFFSLPIRILVSLMIQQDIRAVNRLIWTIIHIAYIDQQWTNCPSSDLSYCMRLNM